MKLNKSELVAGAGYGAALTGFIGPWVIVTAPTCALLWALGGSVNKVWRQLGVAVIAELVMMQFSTVAEVWAFWVTFLTLCIGYGIPTPGTRPDADEGSALGKFWYDVFNTHEHRANYATRITIALLLCLAYVPAAFTCPIGFIGFSILTIVWVGIMPC